MLRLDELQERALHVGVRDHGLGGDTRAVAEHEAGGAPVLDSDAGDAGLKPNLAATRLDRLDEDIRESSGTTGRIGAAMEVIAKYWDHLAAGQRFRPIADITDQHIDHALRFRIANMLRDEFVERLVLPVKSKRIVTRKGEHGVDAGRYAGDAAIVAASRKHAVVDGANIGKQRLETRCARREQASKLAHVVVPVARYV